jgi:hypothetical protein
MRKIWQRALHDSHGLSSNIEEMASAKSLVKSLPHLGSRYSEALPSAKRLRHFFTVEMASASVSETDLSSAATAEARRPFSVRKRMTARYFIHVLNVQTGRDALQASAGADVVGARRIFEREIGEEGIVCRMQSLIMISAHDRVR